MQQKVYTLKTVLIHYTENDENDHPDHKDTSIAGNDTINHHSRNKQLKQPQVVATNTPFRENILFLVKKRIKKPSQIKQLPPTLMMLLFSETALSVSTEVSNLNLIKL